jgi:branched-chain amino acid transport system ATP-binding protein
MLEVTDLHVYYGQIHALKGISFRVGQGEIVTLLGNNGAGKTTTLRTLSGLLAPRQGDVRFEGTSLLGIAAHDVVLKGITHVPEGRRIFNRLSVVENLEMGAYTRSDAAIAEDMDRVFTTFPRLKERRTQVAGTLSGGEQQMLAIARILRTGARFLLLDEPTEGLAPVIVQQIGATIRRLKAEGFTILLVEQNFRFAATVADRHYVMERGRVVDMIANAALDASMDKLHEYLGV